MNELKPKLIRKALESELMNTEPSRDIWSDVKPALPIQARTKKVRRGLAVGVLVAVLLIISSATMAVAVTNEGSDIAKWLSDKFGISLVTRTPELMEELKQNGAQMNPIPGQPLKEFKDLIPEGAKLPSYLPEGMTDENASIYPINEEAVIIRWRVPEDRKIYVEWSYHEEEFGKGSRTITNGAATDEQEVKVGNLSGMAFHDDTGWNIIWAQDGHQYTMRTSLSLDTAIKVASSLK